jgi:TonB family protein
VCADRYEFSGTARISFTVTPAGGVKGAGTASGTPEFQSCVADVIRDASFPETSKGITVTYPLVFR